MSGSGSMAFLRISSRCLVLRGSMAPLWNGTMSHSRLVCQATSWKGYRFIPCLIRCISIPCFAVSFPISPSIARPSFPRSQFFAALANVVGSEARSLLVIYFLQVHLKHGAGDPGDSQTDGEGRGVRSGPRGLFWALNGGARFCFPRQAAAFLFVGTNLGFKAKPKEHCGNSNIKTLCSKR